MTRFRKILYASTALLPVSVPVAIANPNGAQVAAGAATVQGQGTNSVTVTQSTDRAIINWNTFNIGTGQSTQFVQPSSSSVTLNRVTGNTGPSVLDGSLTANGRVFLVNPDGILFGANSRINTAGFLATTNDIANADFMAGRYQFVVPGNPSASIVNFGNITAQSGGFAALVAPGVRNSGTISAKLGTVGLASANAFSLDFYGDRLITLGVGDTIASQVRDVATGQTLDTLVKNDGKIKANGGRVELTAASARQVVDAVINTSGTIEANSVGTQNGQIVLSASTASSKPTEAPVQQVKVSGRLSASGKRSGQTGGKILITGENVSLAGADIRATGRNGGGSVKIGGDFQGGNLQPALANAYGITLEAKPLANASLLSADSFTKINVSAIDSGNGGNIVAWSDNSTLFSGSTTARGGFFSGNGGFVEISGKSQLSTAGLRADVGASSGKGGTALFDPADINVDQTEAALIAFTLNLGGNVIEAATNSITINSNILKTSGGDAMLAFVAGNGITVSPNVVIGSSSGKLNLLMDSDGTNAARFGTSYANVGSQTYALAVGTQVLALNDIPFDPNLTSPRPVDRTGQIFSTNASAVLTIDPSARFYLNGGAFTGFSNGYVITQTNYTFQTFNSGDFLTVTMPFLNAFNASCSSPTCGVEGAQAWSTSTSQNPAGLPYYAESLSFNFGRAGYVSPTNVVSAFGLPSSLPNNPTVANNFRDYTPSQLAELFSQNFRGSAQFLDSFAVLIHHRDEVVDAVGRLNPTIPIIFYAGTSAGMYLSGNADIANKEYEKLWHSVIDFGADKSSENLKLQNTPASSTKPIRIDINRR